MVINSLLDTDWYKISMGQVVLFFFKDLSVKYKFILREDRTFPDGFDTLLKEEINNLSKLTLSHGEYIWLKSNPNIYDYYLNWFSKYQFDPNEVKIKFENNKLDITIEGPWERTIYWEVPLLAIISELYFKNDIPTPEWKSIITSKGSILEFPFIDFGTRRRFSYVVQDFMIRELMGVCNNNRNPEYQYFLGTSNPYFAMKYNIPVIGTYAHEAVMAMQAQFGCENCNDQWLGFWKIVYGKSYNIALSDTLTTDYFLNSLTDITFQLLDGIRQDSGDPIEIGWKIINKWKELGIDPKIKKIIFSDNLNPEKASKIWETFKDVTNLIFGIGTNLTNDVGHEPLNMVVKLIEVDGKPVVKLSDEVGKYTGDIETIEKVKKELKI